MNEKTNYGNWVPEKALYLLFALAAVFLTITVLLRGLVQIPVLTIIMGVVFVLTVIMAVYMLVCHETFAFGKGNMMAEVHRHLVEHLEWNGEGTLLDIGCGAAALTVRCAKAFPKAQITAMDYWGAEWNSAKDKRDVVREALRVLKKGGAFSFQDMFSQKALYGDMDAFVKQLKAEGISEIHYIGNLEKKLDEIPGYVTTPWMISGMGIIYGKK